MSALLELAERVEAAPGPDRELDARIIALLAGYDFDEEARDGTAIKDWIGPSYTASLDSAMTLVPDSDDTRAVFWRIGNDGEGGNPGDFKAEVLVASTYTAKTFSGLADTAPLALCAAALRAHASGETE